MGPVGSDAVTVEIELAGRVVRCRQRKAGDVAARLGVGVEQPEDVPATVFMVEAEQVEAGLQPPDVAVDLGTDLEIKSVDRRAPLLLAGAAEDAAPGGRSRAAAA